MQKKKQLKGCQSSVVTEKFRFHLVRNLEYYVLQKESILNLPEDISSPGR